ncbi:MAG: S8 family serine peptidase, partial [Lachnospiraceae bacterium]|nr:S8 family serine peptidase [Lachnospiraceae bacterium]
MKESCFRTSLWLCSTVLCAVLFGPSLLPNLEAVAAAAVPADFAAVQAEASEKEELLFEEDGRIPGELLIIWDYAYSKGEVMECLRTIDENIDIEEHFDNYTLCRVNADLNANPADRSAVDEIIRRLNDMPEVLTAEPNYILTPFALTDDTYSDTQWALDNTGEYTHIIGSSSGVITSTPDIDLDIPEAWQLYQEISTESKEVIVAVIDTGIDYKHPDLVEHMWTNPGEIADDGIDNDDNGYIDDVYGWDYYNNDNTVCHYEYHSLLDTDLASPADDDDHGTHVAGIIAASADNNEGIAGVASNIDVRLMSLKIHGGTNKRGSISNAIKAIKYAQVMGAKICNMSWGTATASEALRLTIQESDMLFVCAAGNDGSDNDSSPMYPASYELDNIISVTFLDPNGSLTIDSNFGEVSVDIAAPGMDIFSTFVGTYGTLSGSSMAVPHVTGLTAMLYSLQDNLSPQTVRELILSTRKELDELNGFMAYPGMPSAYNALLNREQLISDTDAPTLTFETVYDQARLNVILTPDDNGGSGIRTVRYAIGTKELSYFEQGTAGIRIQDSVLSLNKAGTYTFYVSDYAGNEAVYPYTVEDDKTPPEFRVSYAVSKNYRTITVSMRVLDSQSGLKQVKYLPGEHTADDFRSASAGTSVHTSVRGYATLKLDKPGTYSLYAVDYRGNKYVYLLHADIIKTEIITVTPSRKTLTVGSTYQILPILYPLTSTDVITYKSSNSAVAAVTSQGYVV